MNPDNDAFDARLRATWQDAVDAVPPGVAWRLRPARPAAHARRSHAGWPLGAALATAAVLVIAIGLRPHAVPLPQAAPATAQAATSLQDAGDITSAYDHSPEFYAWLASPDAEQLATE